MPRPPPLSQFAKYPFSAGTCLLAVGVTLAIMAGKVDINLLGENYLIWHGQPWRLLTSTLPHAGPFHLMFNVYWVWVFGTIIEEAFGSLFVGALAAILAVGSGAAEYAFLEGGVGLSGVGYGLFGFLWALGRYDRRFADVVDRGTVRLFVGWFFLCIVLTVSNVMPVANIAHGVGAVLGAVAGYAVATRGAKRAGAGALLAVLLAAGLVCSSVLRPKVNFSRFGGSDEFQAGYDALRADRNEEAARFLERAASYRHPDAAYWFDLGIARERLGKRAEAEAAYRRAAALNPNDEKYQSALNAILKPD